MTHSPARPIKAGASLISGGEGAPGILSASTLGTILAANGRLNARAERLEEDADGGANAIVVTPYGDWAVTSKRKSKRIQPAALDPPYQLGVLRRHDSNQSRSGPRHQQDGVPQQKQQSRVRKKTEPRRRLKLEPMSSSPTVPASGRGSETEGKETPSKLTTEIEWIHRHLPVLKLATSKNSRSLRLQLLAGAVNHAATNLALRTSWYNWINRVTQCRRDEQRRLRASRTVMGKLVAASISSVTRAFQRWRSDMAACRELEVVAASVAIQKWIRSVARKKQQQVEARSLAEALRLMNTRASIIQRGYRHYRRIHCLRECQRAATRLQRVLREQLRHRRRASEEAAASTIQHGYRRYCRRRQQKREAIARLAFELGRTCQARHIQRCWRRYTTWKHNALPAEYVEHLVYQVEYVFAVLSIQRDIRRYQWRVRIERKKQAGAGCIQRSWQGFIRRRNARGERGVVKLEREMAALCLQRTYRRTREDRMHREVMKSSTRPLYLRMLQSDDPVLRARLHIEIARSAVFVIQTVWRKHRAYADTLKQRRLQAAAVMISHFMRRARRRCVWLRVVSLALSISRNAKAPQRATRTIQRWFRRTQWKNEGRREQQQSAVKQLAALVSAAISVQRHHRRRKDPWRRILDRFFHHERPKQVDAAVRLQKWWRRWLQRKRAAIERKRSLLDIIEQQRRDTAARRILRAYQRFLDRRNGRLLLKRYQILTRQEMKKRQQRAVIHSFLQEEGQRRGQKQRKKDGCAAGGVASLMFDHKPAQATLATSGVADTSVTSTSAGVGHPATEFLVQEADGRVRYWSEEFQRTYLFDPSTGESSWL